MTKEDTQIASSGLLLDSPRALGDLPQFDLIFGGDEKASKAPDWGALMPRFRNQGSSMWCTAFAACSIGSAFNKKETGNEVTFSPIEMFYRTGGSRYGNTLVNAATGMRQGFVLEEDMPTPIPNAWSETIHNSYKASSEATESMLERGKPYAMRSFSVVSPTPAMLAKALEYSPVMLAIGIGSNYWAEPAQRRSQYGAYHCNVLAGITPSGEYEIFESLAPRGGFNGLHTLASDYEILYAISFADLPNDWYDIQKAAARKPFESALNHYGEKRDLIREMTVSQDFNVKMLRHPTISSHAGKIWTVIVNAIAYGRYSETDILNHLTSIRRTGKGIFDLDRKRNQQ